MEVYAGYCENADWNVGRVIDAVEEMGELDNTLVIYIYGDNGASMEGAITGSFNELTMQNGIPLTPEQQLALIEQYGGLDVWGTELVAPHYAAAWAWAGNCPFQWGKQVASHLGGTRQGMVIRYPRLITDAGGLRSQFTHCIDIGPTILELAGLPEPTHVDGIAQTPMHGTSFLHTFAGPDAEERHTQQYFEIAGYRAMYKDGWWLAQSIPRIPWDLTPETMARFAPGVWQPDDDPAELYYLPDDFTQADDIAAQHPEKVRELRDLFWAEAEKYKVLPLLGGLSFYFGLLPPLPAQTTYTYYGDVQNIASGMIPRIYNHSYAISADLVIPEGGAEGVIVAEADHLGGFSLFVEGGKLRHTYSMMGVAGVPARIRHHPARRRGHRPAGVPRRRAQARHRRRRPPVRQRQRRSARAGWTSPSRSGSPATRAWTSAATTAASSTATTRTGHRSRSPEPSRRSPSTSSRT